MKKRAVALFRVSTDVQDFQMQQSVIRKFCIEKDIDLIDEYTEIDVSGYKTQLKNRTELLKILARAEEEKDFDCLIVYIFDRIIRREDEAPFVLSHLNKFNIECIEATSGEHMKNADMSDKLMNYIKFWLSEYESVKTAQRVTDALKNKNEQSKYTGGACPFGYEKYDTDNYTKKGKRLKDVRINPDEAWIVKDIFDMYTNRGMGSLSISEELNTNPLYKSKNRPKRTRDKDNSEIVHETAVRFRQPSIVRMLRNSIYIGRPRYNTVKTMRDSTTKLPKEDWKLKEYQDNLRIIDDDTFFKAQLLLVENRIETGKTMKGSTKYGVLCSGLAYCECGSKLYSSFSRYKYTKKDGSVTVTQIYRYICRDGREVNQSHKEKYGKTYYAAKKYDNLVKKSAIDFLSSINEEKLKDQDEKNKTIGILDIKKKLTNLKNEKEQCQKNISSFEKRIDEDIANIDIYIKGIRRNEETFNGINVEMELLNEQLIESQRTNENYKSLLDNYKKYYKEFPNNDSEKQKLILSKFADRIIFYNDGVEIVLKDFVREILFKDVVDNERNSMYLALSTNQKGVLNTQKIIGKITVDFNDSEDYNIIEGSEKNELPQRNNLLSAL